MDYQTGLISATDPWTLSRSLGRGKRSADAKLVGWTTQSSTLTAARLKSIYGAEKGLKCTHKSTEPLTGPVGNVQHGQPGHVHVPCRTQQILSVEDLRKMKAPLPLGHNLKPLYSTTIVDHATGHARRHDFAYECPVGLYDARRSKFHNSVLEPPTLSKRLHASQNPHGFFDVTMCTVVPSVVKMAHEGNLKSLLAHTVALLPRPPSEPAFGTKGELPPRMLARITRSSQGRAWEESLRQAIPKRYQGASRRDQWHTVLAQENKWAQGAAAAAEEALLDGASNVRHGHYAHGQEGADSGVQMHGAMHAHPHVHSLHGHGHGQGQMPMHDAHTALRVYTPQPSTPDAYTADNNHTSEAQQSAKPLQVDSQGADTILGTSHTSNTITPVPPAGPNTSHSGGRSPRGNASHRISSPHNAGGATHSPTALNAAAEMEGTGLEPVAGAGARSQAEADSKAELSQQAAAVAAESSPRAGSEAEADLSQQAEAEGAENLESAAEPAAAEAEAEMDADAQAAAAATSAHSEAGGAAAPNEDTPEGMPNQDATEGVPEAEADPAPSNVGDAAVASASAAGDAAGSANESEAVPDAQSAGEEAGPAADAEANADADTIGASATDTEVGAGACASGGEAADEPAVTADDNIGADHAAEAEGNGKDAHDAQAAAAADGDDAADAAAIAADSDADGAFITEAVLKGSNGGNPRSPAAAAEEGEPTPANAAAGVCQAAASRPELAGAGGGDEAWSGGGGTARGSEAAADSDGGEDGAGAADAGAVVAGGAGTELAQRDAAEPPAAAADAHAKGGNYAAVGSSGDVAAVPDEVDGGVGRDKAAA